MKKSSVFYLLLFIFSLGSITWASNDAYYHYVQGLSAEHKGDIATALSEYRKTVELDPHALEAYKDLAQLNLRSGHTEEALQAAEKVKDLAPDQSSSFLFLGNVHLARGDLAKAATYYEQALQVDPNDLQALENLGSYYLTLNSPKALTYFQRYLAIDPKSAEVYFQIGLYYHKQGNLEKAIASFQKSVDTDRSQMAPHLALAEIAEHQGHINDAVAEYTEAVKVDPHNAALFAHLGRLYYAQRQWNEAGSAFEGARSLDPKDASLPYWLARIAEERKQWNDAARHMESAYQLGHESQFLPLWAYYLTLDGRVKEAVAVLEQARRLDPDNANAALFLGMGYLDLGKAQEAFNVLDPAVRKNPNDSQLRFQLAVAYDRLNQFEPAIQQFQEVLKRDPANTAAMNYIGYSYADRGVNLPEAEKLLRDAVRLSPTNGAFLDSLGWVRYKQGDAVEAVTLLEQAAQRSPDALIYDHLGDAYAAASRYVEAMQVWSKALALDKHQSTIKKKIEVTFRRVLPGSDPRKYLKYAEGNLRQINHLRGRFLVEGRVAEQRFKGRGQILYERPDLAQLDMDGPAADPIAHIRVQGTQVQIKPEAMAELWKGFSVNSLVWLPRYFSGEALKALDDPHSQTEIRGHELHYQGTTENAAIDTRSGVLTQLSRENPQGGRDELEVTSYTLVGGLWLPGDLRIKNVTQGWSGRLRFSQWELNPN